MKLVDLPPMPSDPHVHKSLDGGTTSICGIAGKQFFYVGEDANNQIDCPLCMAVRELVAPPRPSYLN